MANAKAQSIDTTCLSLNRTVSKPQIHRDYIAHCFRWSYVARCLNQLKRHKTAHVLDVGCGREVPLARTLYASMLTHTTGSYTGVDYGKIDWPESIPVKTSKFNMVLHEKIDFTEVKLARQSYDFVISFEVLEHVEPTHAFKMLAKMQEMLSDAGSAIISTPCYNSKTGAAANHVNEMTYEAFSVLLRLAGLGVKAVYGTFASQKDYKHLLSPELKHFYTALSEFYDSQVLSTIFAPVLPEQSRNCLWVLSKEEQFPFKYAKKVLQTLAKPEHSSSKRWQEELKQIETFLKRRK